MHFCTVIVASARSSRTARIGMISKWMSSAFRLGTPVGPEPFVPDTNAEIGALTGLRAIAALWVLACHTSVFMRASPHLTIRAIVRAIGVGGYLGVDIFFVLSGFVLAYTYHAASLHSSAQAFGAFLHKRL